MTTRTRYARALLLASLAATVAATALAQGQVYKSRDAQGNVIFSDTSSERASTVTVPPTNTIPVVAAPARPVAAPATGDAAGAGYALAITTPVEGQTVFSAVGALDVSLSVSPALQPGHSLRLLLDGAPADLPQQGSLTLEGLGPGPPHAAGAGGGWQRRDRAEFGHRNGADAAFAGSAHRADPDTLAQREPVIQPRPSAR